jgi:hypothetical protein
LALTLIGACAPHGKPVADPSGVYENSNLDTVFIQPFANGYFIDIAPRAKPRCSMAATGLFEEGQIVASTDLDSPSELSRPLDMRQEDVIARVDSGQIVLKVGGPWGCETMSGEYRRTTKSIPADQIRNATPRRFHLAPDSR